MRHIPKVKGIERSALTLSHQVFYIPKVDIPKDRGTAMKIGYARVSTTAQDHALQIEALKAAGCERIFSEKRSGKSVDGRPEFKKLLRALNPGDTVVVTRLDRLARSSRDLQNIVHDLQELRLHQLG